MLARFPNGLRQGSDATYSDSLEVSANSVRSDLRSFCKYGKAADMAVKCQLIQICGMLMLSQQTEECDNKQREDSGKRGWWMRDRGDEVMIAVAGMDWAAQELIEMREAGACWNLGGRRLKLWSLELRLAVNSGYRTGLAQGNCRT